MRDGPRWRIFGPLAGLVLLVMLVGVGGLLRGNITGDQDCRDKVSVVAGPEEFACLAWIGLDLAKLLGPLRTIAGESTLLPDPGLRLWILIRDRECIVCLDELPLLAAFVDSLDYNALDVLAVAIGDRHETRRTLWGIETGMPVLVSGRMEALATIGVLTTPLRVLTWHGRIVALSTLPIHTGVGHRVLYDLVQRWINN